MPNHVPPLSPTRSILGNLQTNHTLPQLHTIPRPTGTSQCRPNTAHSGHSRIHHTRRMHTSPYCQPTDDSPTHGHPTNSPYPLFHHTESFMGKQSMAQDMTARQSVSVTRDPGAGTNHLPCQRRICQSLRPRNHSVDHTLTHKTLVRRRHCTWSC